MRLLFASCVAAAALFLGPVPSGHASAAQEAAPVPLVLHYIDSPVFLAPHQRPVTAIAFSPDGSTLATGADDGGLRLWNAATGTLESILVEDSVRGISDIAFSPDGRFVAVVGSLLAREIVVWDVSTGRVTRDLGRPDPSVGTAGSPPVVNLMSYKGILFDYHVLNAVAFSPDGRILATAGPDVVLRDAQSGTVITTLRQPGDAVQGIAFAPDGMTLATASGDGKVRLWSVPTGVLKATLSGPMQALDAVAFSPDGQRIVAAGGTNRVGLLSAWTVAGGGARTIRVGSGNIRRVAFLSPNTVLAGAGAELISVDIRGEAPLSARRIRVHGREILAVAASPDGRLAASGGADRIVDVVDLAAGALAHRLPGLNDIISSVSTSGDGLVFATATIDLRFSDRLPTDPGPFATRYRAFFPGQGVAGPQPSEVRIWSANDGLLRSVLPVPPSQVTHIVFFPGSDAGSGAGGGAGGDPGSDQLAVAGWIPGKGGMLSAWDTATGRLVHDFAVGGTEVISVAASGDGRLLASGDADGNLDLWDARSGARTWSLKLGAAVEAVALSADGTLVAAADGNRAIRFFETSGGKVARTLGSSAPVKSLAFSPDGSLLAVGTRDPGIVLWDLRAGTAGRTLRAAGDYFGTVPGFVAFSADGRFIVSNGHGKDIAVFEAATGTLKEELSGHAHAPTAAAFLPDGRLVSGGEERTVRMWDVAPGRLLAVWVVAPADPGQGWDDEWVGFAPSGVFVGSWRLERLVGWVVGGDLLSSPENPDRQRRVGSLPLAAHGR